MVTSDSNLMKSLMYMFTMMMTDALEDEGSAKDTKNVKIWIVVCMLYTYFLLLMNTLYFILLLLPL